MNKTNRPLSSSIKRAYLIVAAVILVCYGLLFKSAILITENKSSMHRLSIAAPHHFLRYQSGETGVIQIDPLLTIYDDYTLLPQMIKRRIEPHWVGIKSFHFDNDSEFAVFSTHINEQQLWAVENIDATEWNDNMFIVLEIIILCVGIVIFIIASIFIVKIAQRIGQPFTELAKKLHHSSSDDFNPIEISQHSSKELTQTVSALNQYRLRIEQDIQREQSFTRYVSHELRTPMTIIKGALSILKRTDNTQVNKQRERIYHALQNMEDLTHTFLTLARDETTPESFIINMAFVAQITDQLSHIAQANSTQINVHAFEEFSCEANSVLVSALLKNLLNNALNCTIDGEVIIHFDDNTLRVIDNGSGLTSKPRGYEGFGIGLVIVKDICQKYGWQFDLSDNEAQGCTALVLFKAD